MWVVLLLAALASVEPERSSPTRAAPRAEARDVEVVLVGAPDARDAAHEVLEELLGALHVHVHRRDADQLETAAFLDRGPSAHRLATVIIDLRDRPAWVFVIDRDFERVLARPVQLEAGFDEVAREEVGAIVAEAIDALGQGGTIGVHTGEFLGHHLTDHHEPPTPPESPASAEPTPTEPALPEPALPEPTPPADPTPPRSGPRLGPSLELAYRLSTRGPQVLDHALDLGGAVAIGALPTSLRVSAHLEGWLPSRVGRSSAPVSVSGLMPSASIGVGLRASRRVTVIAEAGLGLGVLRARSVVSSDTAWQPVPLLLGRTALLFALPSRWHLGIGARVLVDPVDLRILDERGDVLFDPLRAWPAVELVLAWGSLVPEENRRRR